MQVLTGSCSAPRSKVLLQLAALARIVRIACSHFIPLARVDLLVCFGWTPRMEVPSARILKCSNSRGRAPFFAGQLDKSRRRCFLHYHKIEESAEESVAVPDVETAKDDRQNGK